MKYYKIITIYNKTILHMIYVILSGKKQLWYSIFWHGITLKISYSVQSFELLTCSMTQAHHKHNHTAAKNTHFLLFSSKREHILSFISYSLPLTSEHLVNHGKYATDHCSRHPSAGETPCSSFQEITNNIDALQSCNTVESLSEYIQGVASHFSFNFHYYTHSYRSIYFGLK